MADIDIRSKELLASLTNGLDFSVPSVDFDSNAFEIPESLADALKNTPEQLTVGTLTDCTIDGNGCFDKVMTALKAHLNLEYEAGRITGAEYTKAYIASMQGALQFSVQYLLGKNNAYFTSLGSQATALRANIDAYTAKVQLAIAQAQAHQNKAEYANKVLALSATEEQVQLIDAQTENAIKQSTLITAQTAHTTKQTDAIDNQMNLVDAQTETQKQQKQLLLEQTEQAHAQISDTRLDGKTPVSGYTGNQNSLLKQQVISFKKDFIVKGAKVYADSFATQLSMSAATAAGTGLDSTSIGSAMSKLQNAMSNNDI